MSCRLDAATGQLVGFDFPDRRFEDVLTPLLQFEPDVVQIMHTPVSALDEALAVRLYDPRETELPSAGPIYLEDAETGEQIYVDTHDPVFRQRFHQAAQQREADLEGAFRRAGVDALSLSTEEDLVRAIVRFATVRRRRGR